MKMTWLLVMAVAGACGCSGVDRPRDHAPERRFAGKLEPCEPPGVAGGAWCGSLEVPEDRSVRDGRSVRLSVVVLPAVGDSAPAMDAATFLAGGGVAPATRYAAFLSRALSRLRDRRDIVLVDQRGTGASNPLECDLPQPHEVEDGEDGTGFRNAYLEALRVCRAEVGRRADPGQYTTWNAADDLDAVRAWLGYERLDLWGASYGTKLARVYVRRYPDRVRAAVLHGSVPLATSMWPDLLVSADSALARLFDLCGADPACAGAYPDLEAEFEEVAGRLELDPVVLRVPIEGTAGDSALVRFGRRSLSELMLGMLRSSRAARSIPAVLDELRRGDHARIAALQRPGTPPPVPRGVYLSIACTEEIPRLTPAALERAHRASRLGSGEWLDEEMAECEVWGGGAVPRGFWDPVEAGIPVLLITGSEDYVTPPVYAERVAESLTDAALAIVPQRSHDDVDLCVAGWIEDFLIHARDAEPSLGCPEDREPLPFELPSR